LNEYALEPRAAQRGQHAADPFVHAAHHRGIGAERAAARHRSDAVVRVIDRLVSGSFPRRVRRRVVQAQIKRLRALARNELRGAIAEQVGQVGIRRDAPVVFPQIGKRVFAGIGRDVREVIERAAQAAEELVEAVPVRSVFGPPTEVPLADQRRFIPGRAKAGRDRRLRGGQANGRRACGQRLL
jgi:hypothetical protein